MISNTQKKVKMVKFVTFLPIANEAENPFPKVPLLLLVNDMNTWFPNGGIVVGIVVGRVFPVKKIN